MSTPIEKIVKDYLEELLGTSRGFDVKELVEFSYSEIDEVLVTMGNIQDNPDYAYDGSIPTNFYSLLAPLQSFVDALNIGEGESDGISDMYYDRVAKEVLGFKDFEMP